MPVGRGNCRAASLTTVGKHWRLPRADFDRKPKCIWWWRMLGEISVRTALPGRRTDSDDSRDHETAALRDLSCGHDVLVGQIGNRSRHAANPTPRALMPSRSAAARSRTRLSASSAPVAELRTGETGVDDAVLASMLMLASADARRIAADDSALTACPSRSERRCAAPPPSSRNDRAAKPDRRPAYCDTCCGVHRHVRTGRPQSRRARLPAPNQDETGRNRPSVQRARW